MGDGLEFFLEMATMGKPVPILVERPELPDHLKVLMHAYNDLNRDGGIQFGEFALWCDTWGIRRASVQFEFIWDVLCDAQSRVIKWKRQRDKSSQSNSPKTTDRT